MIRRSKLFLLTLCFFQIACAVNWLRRAERLQKNQFYEEALAYYLKVAKAEPDRVDVKISIDRLMKEASQYYYYQAREISTKGDSRQAVVLLKKALEFDPGNNEARQLLAEVSERKRDVGSIDRIKKEMELNVGMPSVLKESQRMDLVFQTKTDLSKIFFTLAKFGNVNILFDPLFRDRKVDIKLVDVTFFEALERLCVLFQCRYFILDNHNIVVTPDDKASWQSFEKLIVKNFFFSNIDAEEARRMIEGVMRPEKIVVNKQTNSLIITDSPDNMMLIEKLVEFMDKRRGEVEIEVEILEVDRNKLEEWGSKLSAYQVGTGIEGAKDGKRLNDFYYLGADDFIFTVPNILWKLSSSITDSQILAKPRVRGLDEEKMEIKLGEKVPIPRTTFVSSSGGGLNDQPVTSYDMQDVGISLVITPRIHHNREVTLDLKFELTYVTSSGSTFVPPTLGNRAISTKLRLLDMETGIIAGLMRGSTTGSREGIPPLNSIPILKEILSARKKTHDRTDILLSITPHILRMPEINQSDLEAYLIGTREKIRLEKWKDYQGEKRESKK